jgi:hypothetical protein
LLEKESSSKKGKYDHSSLGGDKSVVKVTTDTRIVVREGRLVIEKISK